MVDGPPGVNGSMLSFRGSRHLLTRRKHCREPMHVPSGVRTPFKALAISPAALSTGTLFFALPLQKLLGDAQCVLLYIWLYPTTDCIGYLWRVSSDCDVPVREEGREESAVHLFGGDWCRPAVLRVRSSKGRTSPPRAPPQAGRARHLSPPCRVRAACSAPMTMSFPHGHNHGSWTCELTHNAENARVLPSWGPDTWRTKLANPEMAHMVTETTLMA